MRHVWCGAVMATLVACASRNPEEVIEENELAAVRAMKSLVAAEMDFRANDRDGNNFNDFWTGDVAGLHRFGLIARELAEADAAPLKPLVPKPVPHHGYLYRALRMDRSVNPEEAYQQATDEASGKVHHRSIFGFVAYPADYGKTGKATFLINEGSTIIRLNAGGKPVPDWHSDDDIRRLFPEPEPPPVPELRVGDADKELKETIVTPRLRQRHLRGKNLLWCATAQVAWNELMDLAGGPVRFKERIEIAEVLNLRETSKADLDEAWHVARAGRVERGIVEEIRGEFRRKFPDRTPPFLDMDLVDFVAYAYLFRDLPFRVPMTRSSKPLDFKGRQVIAFGRKGADGQVKVWRCAAPADFVVELKILSDQDRLIVARIPPGSQLKDTVASAMKHASGTAEHPFGTEDEFLMPCFNFDVTRRYGEVIGPVPENPFFEKEGIGEALQAIRFKLDEKGALLESAAAFTRLNGDPPRRMICDGPFLVLLVKQGARNPYFALWVETPELLAEAR